MVWLLFIGDSSRTSTPLWPLLLNAPRNESLSWTMAAQRAFKDIKQRLCKAPVLTLSNFEDLCKLACDASGVRIGVVLV